MVLYGFQFAVLIVLAMQSISIVNTPICDFIYINRQYWGLTYGTDGDPKDWMISQEVDLEFDITAKK
jgi:hypothetical protein